MKIYCAYQHPTRPARLVAEGFSWGALILGPLWLGWRQAWISAALLFAALVAAGFADGAAPAIELGLALLAGLFGRDLVRWEMELRGWHFVGIVAGRDEETAFVRLLGARPELASGAAGRF